MLLPAFTLSSSQGAERGVEFDPRPSERVMKFKCVRTLRKATEWQEVQVSREKYVVSAGGVGGRKLTAQLFTGAPPGRG